MFSTAAIFMSAQFPVGSRGGAYFRVYLFNHNPFCYTVNYTLQIITMELNNLKTCLLRNLESSGKTWWELTNYETPLS